MKQACKCAIQEHISKHLAKVRFEEKMTQDKFAELLMVNPRSYSNLEKGKSCCCTLTFIMFLVFCCKDVEAFTNELRTIITKAITDPEL